jgi:hypothetical protein
MPLPSVANGHAKQCDAICRSRGDRCKNPAAFGMRTCRYHGARRPETVRRGDQHPGFRHGWETVEAKKDRASALLRLKILSSLL